MLRAVGDTEQMAAMLDYHLQCARPPSTRLEHFAGALPPINVPVSNFKLQASQLASLSLTPTYQSLTPTYHTRVTSEFSPYQGRPKRNRSFLLLKSTSALLSAALLLRSTPTPGTFQGGVSRNSSSHKTLAYSFGIGDCLVFSVFGRIGLGSGWLIGDGGF